MRILKKKINILVLIIGLFSIPIFHSCDLNKLEKTPIDNFVGVWEIQGRPMFNGMKIRIEKNKQDDFIGKVIEMNDNKYVKMFVEKNDIWITGLKRSSNFEFKLTEKKIASEIFAIYGQETISEYNVQFINKNLIGLSKDNSDPVNSIIKYKRIENE